MASPAIWSRFTCREAAGRGWGGSPSPWAPSQTVPGEALDRRSGRPEGASVHTFRRDLRTPRAGHACSLGSRGHHGHVRLTSSASCSADVPCLVAAPPSRPAGREASVHRRSSLLEGLPSCSIGRSRSVALMTPPFPEKCEAFDTPERVGIDTRSVHKNFVPVSPRPSLVDGKEAGQVRFPYMTEIAQSRGEHSASMSHLRQQKHLARQWRASRWCRGGYGTSSSFPVVRRPARSSWAWAASASG